MADAGQRNRPPLNCAAKALQTFDGNGIQEIHSAVLGYPLGIGQLQFCPSGGVLLAGDRGLRQALQSLVRLLPRDLVRGLVSENYSARKPVVTLTTQNDKCVVVTVHSPRAGRHFAEFDELPITPIFVAKAQVIADRGRYI